MVLYACDRNLADLKKAKREKVIDDYFISPRPEYFRVDLVVFSLPLGEIPGTLKKFGKFIRQDCLITDTASTKKSAWRIFSRFRNYTGSHPLAGSEKQGYRSSHHSILSGHICILTEYGSLSSRCMRLFWEKLGMRTVYLSPAKHDQIIGMTSHFVHFLSYTYSAFLKTGKISVGNCYGPAFRQFTRLARSSPDLWADIFMDNKKEIAGMTGRFIRQIKIFLRQTADREKLRRTLVRACQYIRKLNHE